MRRPGTLAIASLAFLAMNLVHGADHLRQGTERLATEVSAGGSVLTVAAIAAAVLALARHGRAPLVAAVVGLASAAGVAASHLAPHWSAFSDPYPDLDLDWLSWAIMLGEIAAALALGIVGAIALRRRTRGTTTAVPTG